MEAPVSQRGPQPPQPPAQPSNRAIGGRPLRPGAASLNEGQQHGRRAAMLLPTAEHHPRAKDALRRARFGTLRPLTQGLKGGGEEAAPPPPNKKKQKRNSVLMRHSLLGEVAQNKEGRRGDRRPPIRNPVCKHAYSFTTLVAIAPTSNGGGNKYCTKIAVASLTPSRLPGCRRSPPPAPKVQCCCLRWWAPARGIQYAAPPVGGNQYCTRKETRLQTHAGQH